MLDYNKIKVTEGTCESELLVSNRESHRKSKWAPPAVRTLSALGDTAIGPEILPDDDGGS